MSVIPQSVQAPVTQAGVVCNYVGGEWFTLEAATHRALPVHDPGTGELIAEVRCSSAADVDAAVQAAAKAFVTWRRVPPIERIQPLFRLKLKMEDHLEELAALLVRENGKTLTDARGSVRRAIQNIETACGIPSLMMGYGLEDGGAAGIDEHAIVQPLGVFAAICPFNFPLMVPCWFWPYAVATGNTFIVKPSERVPLSMTRLAKLAEEAGLPPGVLNVVQGDREASQALIEHPDVAGISSVGSTPVAQQIYALASARGKRVQSQGGAKNVLVVMPDAAWDPAMENVLGSCFGAAGQRCLAGSIVLAVGPAYEELQRRLVAAACKIRVGYGLKPQTEMGPVISEASRKRIRGAIDKAKQEGMDVLLDGREHCVPDYPEGYYLGPTVLAGLTTNQSFFREEVFGPVIGIGQVKSLEEALDFIRSNPHGNAASIFTQSGAEARQFQYEVPCGNVGINVGVAAPMAFFPFGGQKNSFYGTLHSQGRDVVAFYTDHKVVMTRWF